MGQRTGMTSVFCAWGPLLTSLPKGAPGEKTLGAQPSLDSPSVTSSRMFWHNLVGISVYLTIVHHAEDLRLSAKSKTLTKLALDWQDVLKKAASEE